MSPQYELFTDLPEPGPSVAPSIEALVRELRSLHNTLAAEGASLGYATPSADIEQRIGQAGLTTRIMAVLARRLDPDVSKRLHKLAAQMERQRHLAAADVQAETEGIGIGRMVEGAVARSSVVTAMALSEGLMIATMIDGPARGSGTVNVWNAAFAHSEATAVARSLAEINQLAAEVRSSADIPDEVAADIASDLEDLRRAVEEEEDEASLLARLGGIADKAKPYASIVASLAAIAGQLFG